MNIKVNGPYVMNYAECRWELIIDDKHLMTVHGVGFHEAICHFALHYPDKAVEILTYGIQKYSVNPTND